MGTTTIQCACGGVRVELTGPPIAQLDRRDAGSPARFGGSDEEVLW